MLYTVALQIKKKRRKRLTQHGMKFKQGIATLWKDECYLTSKFKSDLKYLF
jgi:hypothetical protein